MNPRRRRRDDPRRTPEAKAAAQAEARERHDAHVIRRLQQDLNDTEHPRKETEPS